MVEYTERQKRILAKIPEDDRGYQKLVCDSALELYELIKDEPTERLALVVGELTELANNSMFGSELSNPREQFDPTTRRLHRVLNKQDHSANTYSCTVMELTESIRDYRGITIVPKGLEGAVISVGPDGVSTVRDDCK